MVKVKVLGINNLENKHESFNHPMVKVKASTNAKLTQLLTCFNHPMVKVKGDYVLLTFRLVAVSTTLW